MVSAVRQTPAISLEDEPEEMVSWAAMLLEGWVRGGEGGKGIFLEENLLQILNTGPRVILLNVGACQVYL